MSRLTNEAAATLFDTSELTVERTKHDVRKSNRAKRDERLKERYNELYNAKRLRYDDCIAKLAEEFILSPNTVAKILQKA